MNNYQPELTLGANSGYTINEDRIEITIDEIKNNRDINNISGSLAIELWALKDAYDGNSFANSHCMASTTIGEIQGQHFLENCNYDLILNTAPAGKWNLSLMLREYNGQDYVTVDYRNFEVPYIVEDEVAQELCQEEAIKIEKEAEVKVESKKESKCETNTPCKSECRGFFSNLFKKIFK